jgi:hypothetical protein
MGVIKRAASSILLASGVVLVFVGLTAALGFGTGFMLASIAVIAALLYAGGLWFGGASARLAPAGAETVIVFDRSLRVAAGAAPGTSILSQFPEPLRPEIEVRCRLALKGEHTHFDCEHADALYIFQEAQGTPLKAIYFDNEGHVIHYEVSSPAPNSAVFLSVAGQPGPRFRLVYQLENGTMHGKFQMAAPGQDDFKSYLEWSGRKK